MDLKLNFNAEEVAEAIKKAMLTTSFESIFQGSVKAALDDLSKGTGWGVFENKIKEMVTNYMMQAAREILEKEHGENIRKIITAKLAETKLDEMAEQFVSQVRFNRY